MSRLFAMKWKVVAILAAIAWHAASAVDVDPCTRFKWDISRELAVMKQTPQAVTAAVKPGADVPLLKLSTLYTLKLTDQSAVRFVISPAKSAMAEAATAGFVRFRTDLAGRYRVSITSGHWVDVINGVEFLKALDFQGHVGCERPRKIVEFELPANPELVLQLSGSKDAEVLVAITAVTPAAGH